MYRYLKKISYTLLILFFSFLVYTDVDALDIDTLSDTMTVQHAGQYSQHTILFKVTDGVLVGEQIEFSFESFDLGNLTSSDITLFTGGATSASRTLDNNWSLSSSAFTAGDTQFHVNFSASYPAGTFFEFRVGGTTSLDQIKNPLTAGASYALSLRPLGVATPGASVKLPIIDGAVGVYAKIIPPPSVSSSSSPSSSQNRCRFGSCLFDDEQLTTLMVSGWSHFEGRVEVYYLGNLFAELDAKENGFFSLSVSNLRDGEHTFSFVGIDNDEVRAPLYSYTATISSLHTHVVEDILLPPTIDLYSIDQKGSGHTHGDTVPFAFVDVYQDGVLIATAQADQVGHWSYNFERLDSNKTYLFTAVSKIRGLVSNRSFAEPASYKIFVPPILSPVEEIVTSEREIFTKETICLRGDANGDGIVSLQDMSAATYWRNTRGTVSRDGTIARNREDHCLNNDRSIDLRDYSIISYYWKETWSAIKWLYEGLNNVIPFREN